MLKVLQKPCFHVCWDSVNFGSIFTWFSMALGPIVMTSGGLKTGLKLDDFQGDSGVISDPAPPPG